MWFFFFWRFFFFLGGFKLYDELRVPFFFGYIQNVWFYLGFFLLLDLLTGVPLPLKETEVIVASVSNHSFQCT